MKKDEIIAELTRLGIDFDKKLKKGELEGLLPKSKFLPPDTFKQEEPQPVSMNQTWSMKKPRSMGEWSARQLEKNHL